jgi:8-oxo-dGTP diphosphatase
MQLATLCYVRDKGRTLMIHRSKKKNDIHMNKWNGLGGKFKAGESPEECVIREVSEESGLTIQNPIMKGFLTFPEFSPNEDWYVFVFIAYSFYGTLIDSSEGHLSWIKNQDILKLNLWEGDRKFLFWLEWEDFFSGKFIYKNGKLLEHMVNFYPKQ